MRGELTPNILWFTFIWPHFILFNTLWQASVLWVTPLNAHWWCCCVHLQMWCSTHCSGDWQEAVIADEDDVEDGRRTQQVVHDQPQLAHSSAQSPPACEYVRHVDWDAERPYRNSYWKGIRNHTQYIFSVIRGGVKVKCYHNICLLNFKGRKVTKWWVHVKEQITESLGVHKNWAILPN